MRYKNPTPNPLIASDEGAKMYLIRAETAVNPFQSEISSFQDGWGLDKKISITILYHSINHYAREKSLFK
jgi:hypothetical protein